MIMEKPLYIPLEREVKEYLKKAKGAKTYSEFVYDLLQKNKAEILTVYRMMSQKVEGLG